MHDMTIRQYCDRRLSGLRLEREDWFNHWKELADYIMPRRGRFLLSERNKGNKINTKIIDNTGTIAARTLASGMMSGITSPARPWFRLTTADPGLANFEPVKEWLYSVETVMRRVFATSNIYNCLHTTYYDLGVFGTSGIIIDEDREDMLRGYPLTTGEFFYAVNDRLEVETMYREYSMTVWQCVSMFGLENVSPTVRSMYDRGNYDQWVEVIHALERNPDAKPMGKYGARMGEDAFYAKQRVRSAQKAFRSCYYEKGANTQQMLRCSGYDEFPLLAPRWDVTSTDAYGRSPGMDALGDVKQLQHMEKKAAQAVDKMVTPPLQGPSSMKNTPTSGLPGGMNYVDAAQPNGGLRPVFEVNPRLAEFNVKEGECRNRINSAFFADLFLMMAQTDRKEITAREVQERHEEKMLALGPVLERLQNELLDPLIDRTFEVLVKHSKPGWDGLDSRMVIPPPPKELVNMDIKVDYVSILAQAQKAIATGGIERLSGFVGNLAGVNPQVLDKIDFDRAVDEYGDALGISPKIIRGDEEVKKIRDERNKAMAQQQQAAQMQQVASTAVQGAEVMSKTDTGSKNLLTDILGMRAA